MTALANLLYHEGKTAEAEHLFQRASALPDNAYRPLHAIFLLETGKNSAIAEFDQIYKADRKDRDHGSSDGPAPRVARRARQIH